MNGDISTKDGSQSLMDVALSSRGRNVEPEGWMRRIQKWKMKNGVKELISSILLSHIYTALSLPLLPNRFFSATLWFSPLKNWFSAFVISVTYPNRFHIRLGSVPCFITEFHSHFQLPYQVRFAFTWSLQFRFWFLRFPSLQFCFGLPSFIESIHFQPQFVCSFSSATSLIWSEIPLLPLE